MPHTSYPLPYREIRFSRHHRKIRTCAVKIGETLSVACGEHLAGDGPSRWRRADNRHWKICHAGPVSKTRWDDLRYLRDVESISPYASSRRRFAMASNVTVYLNRSASPIARLVRMLRTCGKARTAYAIVRWATAVRWWPKRLQFMVTEVFNVSMSDLDRSQRIPRVFTVRRAEEKDLPALQKYFAAPERVRDRFRRGDVCVMTLAEGEICAAVWLAAGPADIREDWDDIRCVFSVPADVAWSFDGRGAKVGAWGSLMARLPEFLDELHIAEIFTLIDFRNRPSFDSHKSLGYQSVGLIFCLQMFGLALHLFKPRAGKWRRLPTRIGKLQVSKKDRR